MHERIAQLLGALAGIADPPLVLPSEAQHGILLRLRDLVTYVSQEDGVTLSDADEVDRQALHTLVTSEIGRQEALYKENENRWAA